MIPTPGFGPERTWEWCFDGLPMNSSVAITTNGTLDDPEARRLFIGGSSSKGKNKTYYDTGGHKVKDSNAVAVAEYFIDKGKYVAFLQ